METLFKTPEQAILEHLKENGQSISWLAKKLDLSTGHLYMVLKGNSKIKRELSEVNRLKINQVLKTNY